MYLYVNDAIYSFSKLIVNKLEKKENDDDDDDDDGDGAVYTASHHHTKT